MKEDFRSKKFSKQNQYLLQKVIGIIEEYSEQNISLTLRQLYYQLVARDIIPNKLSEYSKLSGLVTDARYCGLIDWDAIEDRIRIPKKHSEFDDVLDLVNAAVSSFRLDRWKDQEYYVELFTEKDALSSVLEPITNKYHIYLNVNRGYSSATAMYDTSKRFLEADRNGKKCILLYLGDHDPSGLDMIRDIKVRLAEFCEDNDGFRIAGCDFSEFSDEDFTVKVIPVALTKEQIEEYSPPPNPAKITDPRAKRYIEEHGGTSWEVDALKPELMKQIVVDVIKQYVDWDKMQEVIDQEEEDKQELVKFAKKLQEDDDTTTEDI